MALSALCLTRHGHQTRTGCRRRLTCWERTAVQETCPTRRNTAIPAPKFMQGKRQHQLVRLACPGRAPVRPDACRQASFEGMIAERGVRSADAAFVLAHVESRSLGQLSPMGASANIVRVGNASGELMSRCFAGATSGMSQPGCNG